MNSFIESAAIKTEPSCKRKLTELYKRYRAHTFDLLGSGYVKTDYRLRAKGVCGHRYTEPLMGFFGKVAGLKLRGKCTEEYDPLNWFADYKSGFFFCPWKYNSMQKCYSVVGKKAGADIKCPWELGRFYHLAQMAVLAAVEKDLRVDILTEYKNEITDFMIMNPVGKTVQWSAPMDVSVRVVNLLIAHDILTQIDEQNCLDQPFQRKFGKLIQDSLNYIMQHAEYTGGACSNHYLSNLVGIIFAAAYLPGDRWTDACLVFGVQELIDQVEKQFYEEGAHFEGSSSYHRLSAEFVLYATAIVYGVLKTDRKELFLNYDCGVIDRLRRVNRQKYHLKTDEFFPQWYIDRVFNMGVFTKAVLKDNNEIVQIGDNDSGRLVRLTPVGESDEEKVIDHRTLLSALSGLFADDIYKQYGLQLPLEAGIIRALSAGQILDGKMFHSRIREYGEDKNTYDHGGYSKKTVLYREEGAGSLLDGITVQHFADFGIVVLRGTRLYLSMVIDTAQNAKYAGHTHNDRLSLELMIDGKYITRDPGGYIYTAAPDIRDKFRSVNAHNVIRVGDYEQNCFDGTFGLKKRARAELLYCCKSRIVARAVYAGIEHTREVLLKENEIVVNDYANRPFVVQFKYKMYSTGYGKLERSCDDRKQI